MEKLISRFVFVGLAGGFASGIAGIGGGVVMVPLMVGVLAMNQLRAQGTSLIIIVPTAIVSGALYFLLPREGAPPSIDLITAYAIPAMIGAPLGARLARRLDGRQLKRLFGLLLVGVAARLLIPGAPGAAVLAICLAILVVVATLMILKGSIRSESS